MTRWSFRLTPLLFLALCLIGCSSGLNQGLPSLDDAPASEELTALAAQTYNITYQVKASADDAEEPNGRAAAIGSTELEIGQDAGVARDVGVRFSGVTIPPGAIINSAFLEFKAAQGGSAAASFSIAGEASDNAAAYTNVANSIKGRVRTASPVAWQPTAWTLGGTYRSGDVKGILQQIINRAGWRSGNAAAFMITGSGTREAVAFDSAAANATKLVVSYTYDPNPPPTATNLTRVVAASADDAEEPNGRAAAVGSTVLELGVDAGAPRVVGMRFSNLTIPTGATINSAVIELVGTASNAEATSLTVVGEAADNAAAYANVAGSISGRLNTKTAASAAWAPGAWAAGTTYAYRTSELKSILQEIVNRPGWRSGNAAAFMINGTGIRKASAFDGGAAKAPRLVVSYTPGTTTPPTPTNPCDSLSGTLPSDWSGGDVGTVTAAGKAGSTSGVFDLCGYGAGLGGTTDSFHYVRQTLTGDGTLTARLTSLDAATATARGGVMIRETTATNAKYAALYVDGANAKAFVNRGGTVAPTTLSGIASDILKDGLVGSSEAPSSIFEQVQGVTSDRDGAAGVFEQIGSVAGTLSPQANRLTTPVWLRITRKGTTVSSYTSADGQTWTPTGTTTLTLAQSVQVGLFSTGQGSSTPATARFDNVTIGPVVPSEAAPVAALTATPTSGTGPLAVTFDGSTSQRAYSYAWDFNATDGITVEAQGPTASTTYSTPGTYTATLTVTDVVGRTNQATTQITVNGDTPPYEPPDPNTEPVVASPTLDIGVSFAGGEMVFDAYGSQGTGLAYAWSFGDGTTATDPYVVHGYDEPGTYTVSLKITNSVGRTNTVTKDVTVLPEIGKMLPQGGERRTIKYQGASSLNVSFDAGDPVPGLRYVWSFGDGSTAEGSKTQHRYNKVGSYTYTLEVYDERATNGSAMVQALAVGEPALEESSWVTVWAAPPKANFTMTNTGAGVKDGPFYGSLPLNMNFNAGASEGNGLTYAWDFGDGATAEGTTTSHTYEKQGLHQVKLTVTDENNFTDTFYRFVRTTPLVTSSQFTAFGVIYPSTASASAMSMEEMYALGEADTLSPQQAQAPPVINETFPYVFLLNATAGAQANNFLADHGGFYCPYRSTGAYDDYYTMTVNGTPVGSSNYLVGVDYYNPNNPAEGGLCSSAIILRRTTTPLLQSRADAEIRVATPLQDFRYQLDTIAGVRVPRVFVTVLPDAMIPGDKAGPLVREYTIDNGGKKELMMTVAVRESEAQSYAEFAVPVYGVDRNGALASNANGYFNATFEGLTTNCDDCVMVGGRSLVNVKIPLGAAAGREIEFNLNRVRLSRDGTCTNDTVSPLRAYLSGCVTVDAGHEVPANAPALEPYTYALPAAALARSGAVTLGVSGTDRDTTWANFGNTSLEVASFALNFVPFLSDGADLLTQVFNTATGQGADPVISTLAAAGLILDTTTGGAADFTAIVKGAYKFSLRSGGVVAGVVKTETTNLLAGGSTATQYIGALKTRFKTLSDFATLGSGCGFIGLECAKVYDGVAKSLKQGQGLDDSTALAKLDEAISDVEGAGISTRDFLDTADEYDEYFDTDMDAQYVAVWMCGVSPDTLGSLQAQARRGCADSKILTRNLEPELGPKPAGTAAHHIVAVNEGRIPSAVTARNIFNSYGLDINDAVNGVFLPANRKVAAQNPNLPGATHSTLHTRVYYDTLLDRLDDLPDTATVSDLVAVLRQVRAELLTNDFPH